MSRSKGPIHCPIHEGKWSDKEPCLVSGASCTVMAEATLLQDRLDMIAALAEDARTSYLQNAEVMPGVSVSAALETVRLLARSITEDEELKDGGLHGPGRRSGAVDGSQAEADGPSGKRGRGTPPHAEDPSNEAPWIGARV